jgi:hypothetical protein
MNTKTKSSEGIIYQVVDSIEGHEVIVDITYSAGENGELEFEYAEINAANNSTLTEDQIRTSNKVLECGLEEDYVRALVSIYKREGIAFLPNHYEFND